MNKINRKLTKSILNNWSEYTFRNEGIIHPNNKERRLYDTNLCDTESLKVDQEETIMEVYNESLSTAS